MEKAFSGEPVRFSRQQHNRTVDAVRATVMREHSIGRQAKTFGRKFSGTIPILNASHGDLDQFAIVALDQPITTAEENEDEFTREPTLQGVTPTEENKEIFAILQAPASPDAIVDGLIVGVSLCWVDMKNADDKFARAVADESGHLESSGSGPARIIWKAGEEGIVWAVVALGGSSSGLTPYELTGPWQHAEDGSEPPYAMAKPLVVDPDTGFLTVGEDPEGVEEVEICYSMAPADKDGFYVGLPIGAGGDWVWCTTFGGVPEAVSVPDAESVYLVKLDEDLEAQSEADATVQLDGTGDEPPGDGPTIKVRDILMTPPEEPENPEDPTPAPDKIKSGTELIVHWSEAHKRPVPIAKKC